MAYQDIIVEAKEKWIEIALNRLAKVERVPREAHARLLRRMRPA
jgi:hypothetical protein